MICYNERSENPISEPTKPIVIVVDDDQAVRDSLSVLLSLAGLSVSTCASGAELLAVLQVSKPDCLVIDVHMPVMDGLELVTRLNTSGSTVPVILITGNTDAATEAQASRIGVTQLLKKPFSGTQLLEAIKQLTG